jgi:hypothetical protein
MGFRFSFLNVHLLNGLALRYGVAEPILEARRTEARVFAKGEALIVNLYAVVERMDVSNVGGTSMLRFNGTTGNLIGTFASGPGLNFPSGLTFTPRIPPKHPPGR